MTFCLDCFPYDVFFTDYDSTLVSAVSSPVAVEALPAWVTLTIDNTSQPRKVTIDALASRPNPGDDGLTGPHKIRVSDGINLVDTDEFYIQVTDISVPSPFINVEAEGAAPSTGGAILFLYEGAAPVAEEPPAAVFPFLNVETEGASPSTGGVVLFLYEGAAPVAEENVLPVFPLINEEAEGAAPSSGGVSLLAYEGASP
jgi:hypothetical protein